MWDVFQLLPTKLTKTRDVGIEVSEETPASESPTQHSSDHDTLVSLIACHCCAPHGVRPPEGHILGFEIFERLVFQSGTMRTELLLPEVSDIILHKPFQSILAWWLFKE